jgi:hypothetical protein
VNVSKTCRADANAVARRLCVLEGHKFPESTRERSVFWKVHDLAGSLNSLP